MRLERSGAATPLLLLAALLAFNAFATPGFFRLEVRDGAAFGALVDVLRRGAEGVVLVSGLTLVVALRGVDLSVGALMAISGAVAATLAARGAGGVAALLVALGATLLVGALNGAMVAVAGLPPIVATLVPMVAGRGAAQLFADGKVVPIADPLLTTLGSGRVAYVPAPVLVAAGLALLTALACRTTALGLFVRAVGDNPAAARAAGVRTGPLVVGAYAFTGFCAGVAGLLSASNVRAADAHHAGLYVELDATLAVVLGGTSLAGGRFRLGGAVAGALLLQAATTTLYMHGVRSDVAPLPKALLVLVVCVLRAPALARRGAARSPAT